MTPVRIEKSEIALIAVVSFFIAAFDVARLPTIVGAMVILEIMPSVMAPIRVVLAVFAADVLAVNPMMSEVRHVARNPNHFIATVPITRPMVVEWPIANLD